MKSMKETFGVFLKSMAAMKQVNLSGRQLPGIAREFRLWLQITRNFKEIEGSWPAAMRTYMHLFKGVPRKQRSRLPDDTENE